MIVPNRPGVPNGAPPAQAPKAAALMLMMGPAAGPHDVLRSCNLGREFCR